MTNPGNRELATFILSIFTLHLVFVGHAFGEFAHDHFHGDDFEIFPFQEIFNEGDIGTSEGAFLDPEPIVELEDQLESEVEGEEDFYVEEDLVDVDGDSYTEELFDVSYDGLYDSSGELVEFLPELVDEGNFTIPVSPEVTRQNQFDFYLNNLISNWGGKRSFTERRLAELRAELGIEQERFSELGTEIEKIEENLEPIHAEIETLKGQIELLNDQLIATKDKIKTSEWQIAEKQLAIRDLMEEIQISAVELAMQRDTVLQYILLVYQEEEKYFDLYEKGSSSIKLLLADNSVSENLLGVEYLSILESAGRDVFYDLDAKKRALETKRTNLQVQRFALEGLYRKLNNQRRILDEGRRAKKELLAMTRGQEDEYQRLLDLSIQQRLEAAIAIQNMQDNIGFIEQQLSLLDESIDQAENLVRRSVNYETVDQLQEGIELIEQDIEQGPIEELIPKHQAFTWPVEPKAVTAYYKDPTYPKKWGIHNAIDLRAKQYTEIKAPANAYVFQAKDNGLGYSYIILAHKNQLMTVYGHVSEILVEPGTVVKQGDVIGLSGGTPGTKGAGWQTTGPHLHFEVYQKGVPVNPLDFLPVKELPLNYVPDHYLTPRERAIKNRA